MKSRMYKGVYVSWHGEKYIIQTVLFKRETRAMTTNEYNEVSVNIGIVYLLCRVNTNISILFLYVQRYSIDI